MRSPLQPLCVYMAVTNCSPCVRTWKLFSLNARKENGPFPQTTREKGTEASL
ncbi:hypothetical protein LEMLEM_LOCUS11194, partial [Lemmus lemmus]